MEPESARPPRRARFLDDLPSDPQIEPIIEAFEAGNYARVHELATELLARSEDEDVRRAARELERRTEPDPLGRALLLMSIGLFILVVIWTYSSHGH